MKLPISTFSRNRRIEAFFLFFYCGIGLVYWVNIPLTVTWDSQLYILSAESLFTNLMSSNYHWVREPLYPLFLRISNFNNVNLELVKNLQFIALNFSLYYLSLVISKLFKNYIYMFSGLVSFAFLAGYAATVLQQSLIVVVVVCHIVLNIRLNNNKEIARGDRFKVVLLMTLTGLLSVILLVPSILNFFVMMVYKKKTPINTNRLIVNFAVLLTIPILTQFTWNLYKLESLSVAQRVYDDEPYFWKSSNSGQSVFQRIFFIPSTFFGITGVAPEIYKGNSMDVNGENQLFAFPSNINEYPCGRIFPGPPNVLESISGVSLEVCQKQIGQNFMNNLNKIIQRIFPLLSLLCLIYCMVLGFKKNQEIFSIALFPFLVISPYLVGGFGISRYGIPLILLYSILIVYYFRFQLRIQGDYEK